MKVYSRYQIIDLFLTIHITSGYIQLRIWETFSTPQSTTDISESTITNNNGLAVLDHNLFAKLASDFQMGDAIKIVAQQCAVQKNIDTTQPTPHLFAGALSALSSLEVLLYKLVGCHKPDGLLKNVLSDARLVEALPEMFVKALNYFLLPAGFNFRNLIWHGFLSPSQLSEHAQYFALLMCIRNTVESCRTCPSRISTLSSEEKRFIPKQELKCMNTYLQCLADLSDLALSISPDNVSAILSSCILIAPHDGRHEVLMSAFADLHHAQAAMAGFKLGHLVIALLKMLPILEHILRVLFCWSNIGVPNICEHIIAQEEAYYTTLDGFGQRSKHQLLLDPIIVCKEGYQMADKLDILEAGAGGSGAPVSYRNALPLWLGPGIYGLLVDLFMADAGPNLRAKLAHGDIHPIVATGETYRNKISHNNIRCDE